ncbi:MAG TPA: MarR family transcriptional regulator [Acidimicrobiales bacterium]|nr:MarR family transcriptional regulator [Acidimicrobiales bacterium]
MSDGPSPEPADEAVLRFVERFALELTEAGWPRMPARVFACLLAAEDGSLTARELASRLRVSPAAISGGVRYLTQIGLVRREREPGARVDHYRIDDDTWYEAFARQNERLHRWVAVLGDGIEALGPEGPAGHRLQETRAFFAFLHDELLAVLKRWRRGEPASDTPRPAARS